MLILICGRSRAGKTTYSKQFENVLHLDDYGRTSKDRYTNLIEEVKTIDGDVVIDGIFDTVEKRKALIDAYHGEKICIWIDTPLEVIKTRTRIIQPFEPPTIHEGWHRVERKTNDLF